jgi:hypothetical protein
MSKKKSTNRRGLTLIELMAATVIAIIVVSGIGLILADSQRGWNRMYDRIYSDVVTDSYVARKRFDGVVRQASGEKFFLDAAGNWAEVYYYADVNSTNLDRYARFIYQGDGNLYLENGTVDAASVKATSSVETVCGNVTNCVFSASGRSVQMILTLDNGSQTANVVTSCVMHNK